MDMSGKWQKVSKLMRDKHSGTISGVKLFVRKQCLNITDEDDNFNNWMQMKISTYLMMFEFL